MKKTSTESKLAALRALEGTSPTAELTAALRQALGDKSNLVVAEAAALAGQHKQVDLAGELEAAFERFLQNAEQTDKMCRAKLALIKALDELEHPRPKIYLLAARHVQLEPVWGGTQDTAAPLRAEALLSLVQQGYRGVLTLIVDLLGEKTVRLAAAQALGYHGGEAGGLLLRLKARLGDSEPEVVAECLSSLLKDAFEENLAFVTEFLDADDLGIQEGAILAVGESRRPEAFEELKKVWETDHSMELKEVILLAIAMLRTPQATDFLLEILAAGPDALSLPALNALKIHRHNERLRSQVEVIVRNSKSVHLAEQFGKHFPPET
jgi:hypothetical protein